MSDQKYGQIFTKRDLGEFVEAYERLVECGTLSPGDRPEGAVVDMVLEEMRGFNFPPNEPVFVLRGQDYYAPVAIAAYKDATSTVLTWYDDNPLVQFQDWQTTNPDRVKMPD